jgi:hypothetical protein
MSVDNVLGVCCSAVFLHFGIPDYSYLSVIHAPSSFIDLDNQEFVALILLK